MRQYEQVIQAMKAHGGYATPGYLNQHVDTSGWGTQTPFASIRRIVQDERFFFKIRPGLWALKECKSAVLKQFDIVEPSEKNADFTHAYFQGLLLEIGNLKGMVTYVPPQDKNKNFLHTTLGTVSTLGAIWEFTYPTIVSRAKTVDVVWFNDRKMPSAFFEIEHSTDIQNSLLKFTDLQDFYTGFYIVGAAERKRAFESKLSYVAFKDIRERVKFVDYEFVAKLHSKSSELASVGSL